MPALLQVAAAMRSDLRKSGIPKVSELPWGSHFCVFYRDPEELSEILIRYLGAGLKDNEFCVWVTSDAGVEEAERVVSMGPSSLKPYRTQGQLELIPFSRWRELKQDGGSSIVSLLDRSVLAGFDGLRICCTLARELQADKAPPCDELHAVGGNTVLALFALPLEGAGPACSLKDAVREHSFALVKSGPGWDLIESLEAREVRNELKAGEEKLKFIFNNVSAGFAYHRIVLDPRGKPSDYVFIEVNEEFERLTGLKGKDLVGKRVTVALPGIEKDRTDWIGRYGKVALTGEPAQFESYSETLKRWFAVSAFSPHRGYFALTLSDITLRKESEEKVRRLNEELKGKIEELSLANASLRDSRRAALNLMEDALIARREAESASNGLNRSNARLHLLAHATAELLRTGSPERIVDPLCREVMPFLDCHVFFYFLAAPGAGRLRLNAWAGIGEEEARGIEWIEYGTGVCGQVAKNGRYIVAEGIAESLDPITELVRSYGLGAYACHPLIAQGTVLGTLSFGTRSKDRFSPDELALMKAVADQVAVAMERGRMEEALRRTHDELEQRVRERTEELATAVETLLGEISERERAEAGLFRLNRLYAVVSEIDLAIVRAKDRDSIFRDFCRIAVEHGGFLLAWVGVLDQATGRVANVAASGATGYLDDLRIAVNEEPLGNGPTGISLRKGTYYICNDFQKDPCTLPWHEKGSAYGIRSSASIALKEEGRVIGVLTLYAGETEFFDPQHEALLRQMGTDISFALDNLLRESRRREAERALQEETLERVRALEELREKERLLIQQNRQAALGEMIGNIAHQWRQPLNALGLMVQELPMSYECGELTGDYLESTVKRTMQVIRHMSQTIDDFRFFFRPDKERVEFRAAQTIEKVLSIIGGSLKEHQIDVEVKTEEDPVINGFPNEYSQVLLNILLNARDVFVERGTDEPRIRVRLVKEGKKAVVTVEDNAGGIPAEILDKIFDPYFTTKGPDKGTGVGLYMSKVIIEKNMGGSLSARNGEEGAQFRIECWLDNSP